MHILLIEDDTLVGGGIRTGLEVAGYTVDWATTGEDARLAFQALASDAVVLDLGLPDEDGLMLLRDWRAAGNDVPVLVLTARDAVTDRVTGLTAGADDYLLKPFDLDELTARVQALLRRSGGRAGPVIHHGPITLDPNNRAVYRHDHEIELTRREFALLSKMLHARRGIVSVEQLKDSLYGLEAEIESNAINVHIHNVRRKLGHGLIRTVRGLGYRLGDADQIDGERDT
ncbi:response regulator [Salinisphaera sp. USBA-960]|uniref:response regulator n=1 Tax=Salinisphaera orenii TaxID=856731 RepID=UPI000DBE5761|nr:response regulator [Salifodinibacter halophilus]NNC26034.1 response regulator [Salifodinibacter halophilus]